MSSTGISLTRHTLGTQSPGAPETIRTPELCRRRLPPTPNRAVRRYRRGFEAGVMLSLG